MNLHIFTFLLLILTACGHDAAHAPISRPDTPPADSAIASDSSAPATDATINYEIINAPEGTFGYDIIVNGKVMIHQTNIPGMPGLKGFASRDDAARVAVLVMDKLKNKQMPPTVTADELKQLGVGEAKN